MALGSRGVVVGLLLALAGACSEEKPADSGAAGSASGISGGSGQSAGGSSSAGTPSQAGAGPAGKGGTASGNGGASGSGGASGNHGAGKAASGEELAASLTACAPKCPTHQYCALVEVDCTDAEACLVNAVCKDMPTCDTSTAYMCPKSPMETCIDDPATACTPDEPGCNGVCFCNENANPCAPMGLDRRPSVCGCVEMRGSVEFCSELSCPDNSKCTIELGKGYCIVD